MRTAAYIQSLCGTILLGFSEEDESTSLTSIILNSLGIVSTTAIFALKVKLSLNHAQIIVSLLTIIMLPHHIVQHGRTTSPAWYLCQQIRFFIYGILQFWLTLKTPCLGNHPECNRCVHVLSYSGRRLAVNPWHRAGRLFIFVFISHAWISDFIWLYGPISYFQTPFALFSRSHREKWASHIEISRKSLQVWTERRVKIYRAKLTLNNFWLWYRNETSARDGIKSVRWTEAPSSGHRQTPLKAFLSDAKLAMRVPRCQRALLALVVAMVDIVFTEKEVQLNITRSANDWGYGQIASMILSVPSAVGVIRLLLRIGTGDRYAVLNYPKPIAMTKDTQSCHQKSIFCISLVSSPYENEINGYTLKTADG